MPSRQFHLFWLLLAAPAIAIIPPALLIGGDDFQETLGKIAGFLLIAVMMTTPLCRLFPGRGWTRWLLQQRRAMGIAVFGYGVLHALLFFMEVPQDKLFAELTKPASIFGMVALTLFLLPALSSNNICTRRLGRHWKRVQQLVYPATAFVILHWTVTEGEPGPLVLFLPMIFLRLWQWWKQRKKRCNPDNMQPA